MKSRNLTTADGQEIESCKPMILYNRWGTAIAGEAHHYGGDGWQFGGIDGYYVNELYWDRLNALTAWRIQKVKELEEIDGMIALETKAKA